MSFIYTLVFLTCSFALPACSSNLKSLKWNRDSCSDKEIYLEAHVAKPGCYPKVQLNASCVANIQCIIENSYCGMLSDYQSYCICKNGFFETTSGHCVVMYSCSFNNSNPSYKQANCPNETQYCEANRCLCKPNYSYNNNGICIWSVPIEADYKSKSNFQLFIENPTIQFAVILFFAFLTCSSVLYFVIVNYFSGRINEGNVKQVQEIEMQLRSPLLSNGKQNQNQNPVQSV